MRIIDHPALRKRQRFVTLLRQEVLRKPKWRLVLAPQRITKGPHADDLNTLTFSIPPSA